MRTRTPLLVSAVSLVVVLALGGTHYPPLEGDPWTEMRDRFGLELLPDARLPEPASLRGSWIHRGPVNILGRGVTERIVLAEPSGARIADVISITRIMTPSVNDRDAPTVTQTETYRLEVVGPFLVFGGGVRSAAVVDDELVLGGALAFGESLFYAVECNILSESPGRARRVREWRFEFADDPLTKDTGRVRVRHRTRIEGEEEPPPDDAFDVGATFEVVRGASTAFGDEVAIAADPTDGGVRVIPRLTIVRGGTCAVVEGLASTPAAFSQFSRERDK